MFRLSNKLIQVSFEDETELLLSTETRQVTYMNKNGAKATYPLELALDSADKEMVRKLKYTKEILTRLLEIGKRKSIRINGGRVEGE